MNSRHTDWHKYCGEPISLDGFCPATVDIPHKLPNSLQN